MQWHIIIYYCLFPVCSSAPSNCNYSFVGSDMHVLVELIYCTGAGVALFTRESEGWGDCIGYTSSNSVVVARTVRWSVFSEHWLYHILQCALGKFDEDWVGIGPQSERWHWSQNQTNDQKEALTVAGKDKGDAGGEMGNISNMFSSIASVQMGLSQMLIVETVW